MGVINVKFRFLITFAGGKRNVIRNGYMKSSLALAMGYFLYWGCGSLRICYSLSFLECQKYFILKCKQKERIRGRTIKVTNLPPCKCTS